MSYNKKDKMVLCKNYLENNFCAFGQNCRFAHGIEEQKIKSIRKKIYDFMEQVKNNACRDINKYLFLNENIEDEILILTKLCKKCQAKICFGGLNCKKGAYNQQYLICRDNFLCCACNDNKCNMFHLRINGSSDEENTDNETTIEDEDNIDHDNDYDSNIEYVNKYSSYDRYFGFDYFKDMNNSRISYLNKNENHSDSSENSFTDLDEIKYLYDSSSSDDVYASIFD